MPKSVQRKKKDQQPDFFSDVYEVVKLIPPGRVTSYGAIARYLGTGMSARMVGWAMNRAPAGLPAHRVVNRNGLLTGKHHFETPQTMKKLLEREGIRITNDSVEQLEQVFWNPATELP